MGIKIFTGFKPFVEQNVNNWLSDADNSRYLIEMQSACIIGKESLIGEMVIMIIIRFHEPVKESL